MEKGDIRTNPQTWLQLYGDMLYQYALTRVYDSMIAEDIVQETFLSALKGLQGYKGDASEKNWLFAILKNKIIDHFRKKSNQYENSEIPDLSVLENDWFDEEGNWVETKAPGDWLVTENPVERKELQTIINWCKNNLKNLQQAVFTLKFLEDLNSDEICKVLKISTSNYWVLVHRARLQMRDCIELKWSNKSML